MSEADIWHCDLCDFEGTEPQVQGHIGSKHVKKPKPIKHGTVPGYLAERRRGLVTCHACRAGWRRAAQKRRNSKPAGYEHLKKLIKKGNA